MVEKHIPGAAFVLVKDGELFLAKGYGLAILAAPTPVDPETTLFGIASTIKLFTATAVMQLVERGLLNLDDDVNQYLTWFQIERCSSRPVTVADLLTHSGGFDERILGMAHSSFAQPLPPELTAHLAVSYRYTSSGYQPNPPLYARIPPAGGLHTTAADIVHFMIAHLENGRFDDNHILEAETAQLMHQTQFSHHPRLPGWAYGFHEYVANGQRGLMHSGGDFRYTSLEA